jgi:hypothetical protein
MNQDFNVAISISNNNNSVHVTTINIRERLISLAQLLGRPQPPPDAYEPYSTKLYIKVYIKRTIGGYKLYCRMI